MLLKHEIREYKSKSTRTGRTHIDRSSAKRGKPASLSVETGRSCEGRRASQQVLLAIAAQHCLSGASSDEQLLESGSEPRGWRSDGSLPRVGAAVELVYRSEVVGPQRQSADVSGRLVPRLAVPLLAQLERPCEGGQVGARARSEPLRQLRRRCDALEGERRSGRQSERAAAGRLAADQRESGGDRTRAVREEEQSRTDQRGGLRADEREQVHVERRGVAVSNLPRGRVRWRALCLEVGLGEAHEALLRLAVADRIGRRHARPALRVAGEARRGGVVGEVAVEKAREALLDELVVWRVHADVVERAQVSGRPVEAELLCGGRRSQLGLEPRPARVH
mmetsp:Transcript_8819/g.29065  ORF Transcript_8819/g.29065 Transcript_8819/m.29065 type:complete len:336 (+) Transcript_8819:42-1049(+)